MTPSQTKLLNNVIWKIARATVSYDVDEFAQELWIEALKLRDSYVPGRGTSLTTHIINSLHWRRVDVIRRLVKKYRRKGVNIVDINPADGINPEQEADWADLGERVKDESRDVQVLYLRASGLLCREIAERIGVGESRVVQILQHPGPALHRLTELVGYDRID